MDSIDKSGRDRMNSHNSILSSPLTFTNNNNIDLTEVHDKLQTNERQLYDKFSARANTRNQNEGTIFTFDTNNIISLSKTAPPGRHLDSSSNVNLAVQSLQDFPKSLSFADLAAEVPSFEDLRYSANRTFNAQMSSEYAPIRPTSYYSTPLELQSMPQMARNINLSQIPQEYVTVSAECEPSVPLAPHRAAALQHSFGGNMKIPIDIEKWRKCGNGINEDIVSSTTGNESSKRNSNAFLDANVFWRPGAYPVSVQSSGLSRGSSRDDLTSVEGHIFEHEERFRVDRRKLELMMVGRFEPIKEEAALFFQRIGEKTNTTIIWPSRLKIGAKSKKDPHIRVGGDPDGVRWAKLLIMEHLDTKTNRVTMKMDVSYTDHSHVIGKGGNTIRRVMAETGCHIHFPDSNRSNPSEKSNQVSIAGEIEGVEKARARVRELTPLVFTFDLPLVPSAEVTPDPNDPYLRAVQDQYNIQVMFRQKQKNYPTTLVVVKGCQWESARVKEATLLLVDHFCGGLVYSPSGISGGGGPNVNLKPTPMSNSEKVNLMSTAGFPQSIIKQCVSISMNMEISPIHHSVVLGKGNASLRTIMQRTNTTILFPDAGDTNIPSIRKGSVTITGTIHNVYFARQQLLGSLPLVMMFEMPENIAMLDDAKIQKLQEKLDVNISIKPKQRQANKSVMIKAQERYASNIYKARHVLLGIEDDPVVAEIPDTYNVQFGATNNTRNCRDNDGLELTKNNNGASYGVFSTNMTDQAPYLIPPPMPFHYNEFWSSAQHQGWQPNSSLANSIGQRPYPILNVHAPNINGKLGVSGIRQPFTNTSNVYPYPQDHALNIGTRFPENMLSSMIGHLSAMQLHNASTSQPSVIPQRQLSREFWPSQDSKPEDKYNTLPISERFGNALPPNHPYLQDYALLVLKNITRLQQQQQEEQDFNKTPGSKGYTPKNLYQDRITKANSANQPPQRVSHHSSNSDEQGSASQSIDSKSRLQLRAPPPLSTVATTGPVDGPITGDSILSSNISNRGDSTDDNGPISSTWFANSNGLDSLLNSKHLVRNNDLSNFDDDLPSLFAKQGLAKYTDLFLRHEIDIQTFSSLSEQDLKEIGITTFGARKKLLFLSSKVKQVLMAQSPTVSSTTPHQWLEDKPQYN